MNEASDSAGRKRRVTGLHLLRALNVKEAKIDTPDGGGLWLRVKGSKASWLFRYSHRGIRRDLSLGTCYRADLAQAGKSLTDARAAASRARSLLAEGKDPVDERKSQREAARTAKAAGKKAELQARLTLARAARDYHERVIEPNRTDKHGKQWIQSLETHVPAALWHKPIAEVEAPELLDAILGLYATIPETASRVRQRLDAVFEDAAFRKQCASNPAQAIRRKLREAIRSRERGNFAALDYRQVPAFVKRLREQPGTAARALEFALLTAARTSEVLELTASELDDAVWRVPAVRMKAGEEHVVHLAPRALQILAEAMALGGVYIFPSPQDKSRPLSNMAMLNVLRRMKIQDKTTVHGVCRATFSTWAYETGAARPDVIEACLAHREADRVKRAYNRSQFTTDRKALLLRWADYLDGKETQSNVVPLQRAA
jgi:integrase